MVSAVLLVVLVSIVAVFATAALAIATYTLVDNLNFKDHTHEVEDIEVVDEDGGSVGLIDHTHVKADVTDFAHSHVKTDVTDFAHSHVKADVTDFAHTHNSWEIPDFTSSVLFAMTGHAHTVYEMGIRNFVHLPGYAGTAPGVFSNFNELMVAIDAADPGPKQLWFDEGGLGAINIPAKIGGGHYDMTNVVWRASSPVSVILDETTAGAPITLNGLERIDGPIAVTYMNTTVPCMVNAGGTNLVPEEFFLDHGATLTCSPEGSNKAFFEITQTPGEGTPFAFHIGHESGLWHNDDRIIRILASGPLNSTDRVKIHVNGPRWIFQEGCIAGNADAQVIVYFHNLSTHETAHVAPGPFNFPNMDGGSGSWKIPGRWKNDAGGTILHPVQIMTTNAWNAPFLYLVTSQETHYTQYVTAGPPTYHAGHGALKGDIYVAVPSFNRFICNDNYPATPVWAPL